MINVVIIALMYEIILYSLSTCDMAWVIAYYYLKKFTSVLKVGAGITNCQFKWY